ncbi:MAG TPA: ArsR family transcriptional regulator [Solirubrobacterales bacterium]
MDQAEIDAKVKAAERKMIFLLQHPLRKRLLSLYVESKEPLSPKELADYTKQSVSVVGYHVRALRDHGAVYLVEERPRRGSVEHFYAATGMVDVVRWAREALGVKSLAQAVQELREDPEYMERLNRRLEEDRPVLEALKESEEEDKKQKDSEEEGK